MTAEANPGFPAPHFGHHPMIVKYKCPHCGNAWEDHWCSACDGECPECGLSDIEPLDSTPDDDKDEFVCRTCKGHNDGQEGYDGECGSCADKTDMRQRKARLDTRLNRLNALRHDLSRQNQFRNMVNRDMKTTLQHILWVRRDILELEREELE